MPFWLIFTTISSSLFQSVQVWLPRIFSVYFVASIGVTNFTCARECAFIEPWERPARKNCAATVKFSRARVFCLARKKPWTSICMCVFFVIRFSYEDSSCFLQLFSNFQAIYCNYRVRKATMHESVSLSTVFPWYYVTN